MRKTPSAIVRCTIATVCCAVLVFRHGPATSPSRHLPTKHGNVVLSFAIGYDQIDFEKFIIPLRLCFDGDIVLWMDQIEPFMEASKTYRVSLRKYTARTGQNMIFDRFLAFKEECNRYDGYCLAADFRDTFFQANPFLQTFASKIVLSAESSAVKIGQCPHNSAWVESCWGSAVLKDLYNSTPICAGTIVADAEGFSLLVDTMLSFSEARGGNCNDQGALNVVYYTGALRGSAVVQRQGAGVVNTVGYLSATYIEQHIVNDQLVNDDGRPSPVVHQYDRLSSLQKLLSRRLKMARGDEHII